MARLSDKSKLLELLAETPIVSFACKKIGLDRSTYYRWYKDNKDFRDQADRILGIGRIRINDMAESVIIKKINADDVRSSIFWLEHNEPRYKPVRTTYVDPINHKHELTPGEVCNSCGYIEPDIEEYKKSDGKMSSEVLVRHLIERLRVKDTGKKRNEKEIRKIVQDFVEENNLKIEVEMFIAKRTAEEAMKDGEKSEDPIIKGNI
jgi:hypothetical protein